MRIHGIAGAAAVLAVTAGAQLARAGEGSAGTGRLEFNRVADQVLLIYTGEVRTTDSLPARRSAALFHALSDEKRLRILALLAGGELCVCELTEALRLSQSLLSFHLKTLRDAGLVVDRREGRWIHYSLRSEALEEAKSAIEALAVEPIPRVRAARC